MLVLDDDLDFKIGINNISQLMRIDVVHMYCTYVSVEVSGTQSLKKIIKLMKIIRAAYYCCCVLVLYSGPCSCPIDKQLASSLFEFIRKLHASVTSLV